ncbi:4-coumarate--CoA ligase 1-like isoform X1 [Belonocnema kinseyi]|uniref:4-coumarate--CoA ligase 1-like isoform X1 n=1 Tax=Belonocnema kinseyi TaxID=2817044 RepID=UPI00143DC925|nr:4-coumarate--CoA ligase 1-like isoform X1 [Belonocnema kinseyi]XP_033217676.1 4-coumarate--CoA ligase 1-like isoform X1 [Belonocnema kinseyi]
MKGDSNILSGPPFISKGFHLSLGQYLHGRIQKYGSKTALVNADTGEEVSFEKIINDSRKLSVYLQKLGLTTNDRIAICSENNFNFCTASFSSFLLGITLCPANPLYTETEFVHILSISKPKYIFVSPTVASKLRKIASELPWSPKLILLYTDVSQSEIPNVPDIINKVPDFESDNLQLPRVDIENHVAVILYSSGTLGMPKGVMLTDMNLLHLAERLVEFTDTSILPDDMSLTISGIMPFFHGYGFSALFLVSLHLGLKMVTFDRFEERKFLAAIEKYKINILTLVPTLIVFFVKSPLIEEYDLSSILKVICGGAKLSLEMEKAMISRFNLDHINHSYGLTETSFAVISQNAKRNKIGSIGILEPGISAKVISIEDGSSKEALGPYCEGELCFKGANIMKGYCDAPDSTKSVIDKDGWLHSGDVGYYDEDGYFYIVDRIKELIKYKGYQVAPAELEAILMTHPSVTDTAVVGLPDENAGELPLAFVVKKSDSKLTTDEVVNYVNERVSPTKKLRGGVRFVNKIPKNATGKILRRELRSSLQSKL